MISSDARLRVAERAPSIFQVEEWSVRRKWRPSLLLVGHKRAIDAALLELRSLLEPPIVTLTGGGARLLTPATFRGTLILRDAHHLRQGEQVRILEWRERAGRLAQIITTSTLPLLPLVEQGQFLARLYYQLNIIYLELGQ